MMMHAPTTMKKNVVLTFSVVCPIVVGCGESVAAGCSAAIAIEGNTMSNIAVNNSTVRPVCAKGRFMIVYSPSLRRPDFRLVSVTLYPINQVIY